MKHLHKIAFLPLCAALLLAACDRNRHTPDPEKIPLSFTASSQTLPVKAGNATDPKPLGCDFGVWGYATKQGQMDYLIWEESAMSKVTYNEDSDSYIPDTYAFWFSGYAYNFIAVAPYTDGADRLTGFTIGPNKDALTFAYDMSDIYAPSAEGVAPRPGIDLMGSIAKRPAYKVGEDGVQELVFHRLTSRIDINVKFDYSTTPVITEVRLDSVYANATYALSYSKTGLGIDCTIGDNSKTTIPLSLTKSDDGWWRVTLYILPQDVSKFELFMDFTNGNDGYTNFPITPKFPDGHDTDYSINAWHKWNITLTNELFVFFDASVEDWTDGGMADDEIDFH